MRRLLFTLLLLLMVATLGGWQFGVDSPMHDAETKAASAVVTAERGDGIAGSESPSLQPCIIRADCAGAGLLVGPPLLLVVALPVLVGVVLISLGRATTSVVALRPALLPARLDRPPQLSS